MKNEEVRTKNAKGEIAPPETASSADAKQPEPGANSQLHNYNIMLTRLGDLFDDDEPEPPKPVK